jgi:arsenate reductase
MAEGFLNAHYGDRYEGYSVGLEPKKINKYAIKAMREVGIDLSNHKSKSIERFSGMHFDYVVTVCDHAREVCPFFPGDKILHKSFEDPSSFKGTPNEILDRTRRVRDKISNWIQETFGEMTHNS